MNYFATAIPGIGPILSDEIAERLQPTGQAQPNWNDRRNDIVPFTLQRSFDPYRLRTSEDVYVEIGRVMNETSIPSIIRHLLSEQHLARALSTYSQLVRPLSATMTYRVIARVLDEKRFLRSDLRDKLTSALGRLRPRWKVADPAALEFWICEVQTGIFVFGLRVTDATMRHRHGRQEERPGSLRPTVAAAMVYLAGSPQSFPLLDPCCGSGTILRESRDAEWDAIGTDIDNNAVTTAQHNVPTATVLHANVHKLPFDDASIGAIVSNFPFGKRFSVQGDSRQWISGALSELHRVATPDAPIILLLNPTVPVGEIAPHHHMRIERSYPIQLLGTRATLWQLRRSA